METDIKKIIKKIPLSYLKSNTVFPCEIKNNHLVILMGDPEKIDVISDISVYTQMPVKPVKSEMTHVLDQIRQYHEDLNDNFSEDSTKTSDSDSGSNGNSQGSKEREDSLDLILDSGGAVTGRLNHILSSAIKSHASDIHLEPLEKIGKIRMRVHGFLMNMGTDETDVLVSLISRIKVLANLDIAETRVPQDGRMLVKYADKEIDIRVSTLPSSFGERCVLRLLDRSSSILDILETGLEKDELIYIKKLITRPDGIILVTGPTGSGKTTSLYSFLNSINRREKNILTIEDPVEYRLEGISQTQIKPEAGFTFAKGLRSILRQDPDIIMIGEIRDSETAEIAIRASMTGHLVFSTLHTSDSVQAIARLCSMDIDAASFASGARCVINQRLVRTLCSCKEVRLPNETELRDLSPELRALLRDKPLAFPKGCPKCMNSGYSGRTGVFEILPVNEELRDLISAKKTEKELRKYCRESMNIKSLWHRGTKKVIDKTTGINEFLRVFGDMDNGSL